MWDGVAIAVFLDKHDRDEEWLVHRQSGPDNVVNPDGLSGPLSLPYRLPTEYRVAHNLNLDAERREFDPRFERDRVFNRRNV